MFADGDRYCDTHTGDWLIDYHPDLDNLVVATGDSGEYGFLSGCRPG
jgi:hypothetical protein